ncbi:MAG TPA: cytochrome c biogenesis protein CcsA [Bryobacteraceae bacterium]|nr:cytochrome c biogenesis protein CcsA [Bryobacteraceae bacterium]
MAEMSIIWLRVAAGLYSLSLLHAILTVTRRRAYAFPVALGALTLGGIFHLVSIVEQGVAIDHFPASGFYESMSLCAFLITALFLFVYWRYRLESLSVFIFPLVFVMALVASLGRPVASTWSSQTVRDAWLMTHVVLVLLGFAALLFTAVAAILYLLQERELKRKKPRSFYHRLPPLGTLDDLITKFMGLGFVLITLAVIVGSTWAFVEFGTRWVTDPKIGISFFTWGIYLAMVFLRISAGWRGRKAAVMAITALGCSALTWAAHAQLQNVLVR